VESGAGNEVIISNAGQVSHAKLSRYSHVRMDANGSSAQFLSAQRPNVPTAAVGGILPAQNTEFGRHNGRQIAVTFPSPETPAVRSANKGYIAEELHDRERNV
jgi:hypothetical protein